MTRRGGDDAPTALAGVATQTLRRVIAGDSGNSSLHHPHGADGRRDGEAERDENTQRKNFTPSEAVSIGRGLEELLKPKLKERQAKAGPSKGRGAKPTGSVNFTGVPKEDIHDAPKGDARDQVGAAVGMSGPTYEKAKAVVEAAEKEPERFADLKAKMDQTGKVVATLPPTLTPLPQSKVPEVGTLSRE